MVAQNTERGASDMNNISLQYFITVAQELNITKAAEKLFITQQSLSEQIKKLERSYNAVFFERHPRLRLTYQGEQMLAYAQKVVEAERELLSKRVRLSIGQTSSRGAVFMPTIFQSFHREYPNVVLTIINGNHEYITNQLRLGKIEMYMGMRDNTLSRENGDTLYRDKLFFIISRELLSQHLGDEADKFIENHRHGIDFADTCSFPMALPPHTSSLRLVFDKLMSSNHVNPDIILETKEHEIMFDLCKNGLCSCFVSRELLYRKIMHRNLPTNVLFFPANDLDNLSCIDIVYNKNLSPYASAFLQCCHDTISSSIAHIDEYLKNANE